MMRKFNPPEAALIGTITAIRRAYDLFSNGKTQLLSSKSRKHGQTDNNNLDIPSLATYQTLTNS